MRTRSWKILPEVFSCGGRGIPWCEINGFIWQTVLWFFWGVLSCKCSPKRHAGSWNNGHVHSESVPGPGPWIALVTCKGQGAEGPLHGGFYVTAGRRCFPPCLHLCKAWEAREQMVSSQTTQRVHMCVHRMTISALWWSGWQLCIISASIFCPITCTKPQSHAPQGWPWQPQCSWWS